jgi:hypothetical protein
VLLLSGVGVARPRRPARSPARAPVVAPLRGHGSRSAGSAFSILQGELDGRPFIATIDMELRSFPDKETLPFFLGVSTPLVSPTSDGLPTGRDADDLNTWEETVEARLRSEVRFVFVGRVTWNGHRELLYYVDNQQSAEKVLNSASKTHSARPFAVACERDENWQKASFWLSRR